MLHAISHILVDLAILLLAGVLIWLTRRIHQLDHRLKGITAHQRLHEGQHHHPGTLPSWRI